MRNIGTICFVHNTTGGGGYFERVRSVQTTLTRVFIVLESVSDGLSENWYEISRKARKFKGFFRPKSGGFQKKKKKKKRSSPILRLLFRPKSEIQTFFPPKIRWSPKKKGLHPIWDSFFGPYRKSKRLRGAVFLWGGGAIFNFSQKIGLKTTKKVRFWILHKPMGGLEPPLPPPWLRYWMRVQTILKLLGEIQSNWGDISPHPPTGFRHPCRWEDQTKADKSRRNRFVGNNHHSRGTKQSLATHPPFMQ